MQLESSMNIFLTIYIVNIGAFAIVQQHINVDLAAQLKECHRKIEASKVALETPHKKLGFMSEGAELAKDPQIDNDKHKIILTTLKERCKRGKRYTTAAWLTFSALAALLTIWSPSTDAGMNKVVLALLTISTTSGIAAAYGSLPGKTTYHGR